MQKQQFSIEIKAPRERVWSTLWDDKTMRDWANIIDEGMYMEGIIKEGNEVQFISPTGYGVTSLVEKLVQNELVSFRHRADTMDSGEREREKEWTGGAESYSLTENGQPAPDGTRQAGGITTLTVDIDVPSGQEENFKNRLPKALARVKILAEKMEDLVK